jgi:uncharacterized protein (DUF1810 family)
LHDPFGLQRFLNAQESVYGGVCAELSQGAKEGHWMWFIFPQLTGLGGSFMAQKYSISSLEEAKAYVEHPILGARLRYCTQLTCAIDGESIERIFGYPDYLKFRSSMTLFTQATLDNRVFLDALRKYFGGDPDPLTIQRLERITGVR